MPGQRSTCKMQRLWALEKWMPAQIKRQELPKVLTRAKRQVFISLPGSDQTGLYSLGPQEPMVQVQSGSPHHLLSRICFSVTLNSVATLPAHLQSSVWRNGDWWIYKMKQMQKFSKPSFPKFGLKTLHLDWPSTIHPWLWNITPVWHSPAPPHVRQYQCSRRPR